MTNESVLSNLAVVDYVFFISLRELWDNKLDYQIVVSHKIQVLNIYALY